MTMQISGAAHPEPAPAQLVQAHEQLGKGCMIERLCGQMGTVVDVVVLAVRQAPVQPGDHQPFCRVRLLCRLRSIVASITETCTSELQMSMCR
jgi:hypothetical protein